MPARDLPGARGAAWGAPMTSPVARMRVSTVAPRPRPAPKGVGRPVGTPLTVLGGAGDPRGASSAGLAPGRTWLVVVELVDEEGVTGVGTAGFGNPATLELLDQLEPLVVGAAPSEVGRVWESMYRATLNIGRRGVVLHAISAVDIALWDLFGKQLGVPVYELLGGKVRPSLPAYASWLYATEDLDALAAEAAGWAAQGFTAVKQRLPYGPLEGQERHSPERRARPHGRRRGRPGRRRDGRRLHELGRRLRDPLHSRARGRRPPAALAGGAPRARRHPGARAGPGLGRDADRGRRARGDAVRLPRPGRGRRGRRPAAGREPPRRDHRGAARLGAR